MATPAPEDPSARRRRGLPRLSRRTLGRLGVAAGVGAVGAGGLAVESHRETSSTRVEHLDLASERITGRALRVVQLTDVHDLPDAGHREQVVGLVQGLTPDLVAVTGDLVSFYTKELGRMSDLMGRLVALGAPVFFVPGNHEHDNTLFSQVLAMVKDSGATVLRDQTVAHDGPWGKLDLVGIDDYYTHSGSVERATRGVRQGSYRLGLTHSPQAWDDLALASDTAHRVDLAICGHTHGGQVRLPGVGALYSPGGGFLPRLDKGLFDAGSAQLWICSGVGQSTPPRLDCPSQVTLLTVRPSD